MNCRRPDLDHRLPAQKCTANVQTNTIKFLYTDTDKFSQILCTDSAVSQKISNHLLSFHVQPSMGSQLSFVFVSSDMISELVVRQLAF